MNLSLKIATRYLFSKKSHNAINLISMISVCGIAIASMAMVCALSVFNGFHDLVKDMFSTFDPELKITAVKGKVFDPETDVFQTIREMDGIAIFTECLEDNVLVKYADKQVPATLKGVPANFSQQTLIDSIIIDGSFFLEDEMNNYATLGIGLANNLGVNAAFVYPLEIFAPNRTAKVNMLDPSGSFNREYAYIAGVFMMNQPIYDNQCMIVPLSLARELFSYETEVSAIELKLKDNANISKVQKEIQTLLGNDFHVKNRYEQQENSFKMMNIEKWVTFLILCFIMAIAVFNVITSLSMLIIEKKNDIITLRNLGADDRLISRIFLLEGSMISVLGGITGIVLGVLLCLAQQIFGLLKLGSDSSAFTIEAYPVVVSASDTLIVLGTVLIIGFLAAIYPVKKIKF